MGIIKKFLIAVGALALLITVFGTYTFVKTVRVYFGDEVYYDINRNPQSFDMKEELKRLNVLHKEAYQKTRYNRLSVQHRRKQMHDKSGWEKKLLETEIAHQLLNAGYPDSAILIINRLKDEGGLSHYYAGVMQQSLNWVLRKLMGYHSLFRSSHNNPQKQLGLCYLRLGEQTNCVLNHSSESCILPFTGGGLHHEKSGSQLAIKNLTEVLEKAPDDNLSKWLLNMAYATLDQYPSEVAEDQFVDFARYEVTYRGKPFTNKAIELGVNYNGYYGSAIMEDFNNDMHLDIFTTSGRLDDQVRIYFSNGQGGFELRKNESLHGITGGVHAIQADYNNDGFTDILILRGGWMEHELHPNSLLRNNGDGTFTDVTFNAGLLSYQPCHTAIWLDYNLDGYLDLFVGFEKGRSLLYENMNGEKFRDVTDATGILVECLVKGSFAADFNNDHLPDIYISCFNAKNILLINQGKDKNGNYRFEDIAEKAGVTEPVKSFPVSVFDFNNDGLMDIFCTGYNQDGTIIADQYQGVKREFDRPVLYLNNGDETFSKLSSENLERSILAMGINFGDIDNDGYLDIYMGTGYPEFEALVPNLLFRNSEGTGLEDITLAARLGHLQKGHGIAFGDIDRDGHLDIYVNIGGFLEADNFDNALFINPGNENNWVVLKLEGRTGNRSAIGTKVTLHITENDIKRKIFREVNSGGSYGASTLQLHVGLGQASVIDQIEVYWPVSARHRHFKQVPVNNAYSIVEDQETITRIDFAPVSLAGDTAHVPVSSCH